MGHYKETTAVITVPRVRLTKRKKTRLIVNTNTDDTNIYGRLQSHRDVYQRSNRHLNLYYMNTVFSHLHYNDPDTPHKNWRTSR